MVASRRTSRTGESKYGEGMSKLNMIIKRMCRIVREKREDREEGKCEMETETSVIDCIVEESRWRNESIPEILRVCKAIVPSGRGEGVGEYLKLIFGTNKIGGDLESVQEEESGLREEGRKMFEIKLDENGQRKMVVRKGNPMYGQLREVMSEIHRRRPRRTRECFMKYCLENYEKIIKRELFDRNEKEEGDIVCVKEELVDYLFKYSYAKGYRLKDLVVVPLYETYTSSDPWVDGNYPILLCFLYVERMRGEGVEGRVKTMFSIMNLGKYRVIEKGEFETIVPLSEVSQIKKAITYTSTFLKKVEVRKEKVERNRESEERSNGNQVEQIFKSKFSFLRSGNKGSEILESSELIKSIKNRTKEVKVEITILCLYVQLNNLVKYTMHSPFIDEKNLKSILGEVLEKVEHQEPVIKNASVHKEFLKRCCAHKGTNIIFI